MFNRKLVLGIILGSCLFTAAAQVRNVDYYISQGLANSPLLKDYSNQVRANMLDSMRLRAGLKPQVNFEGLLYVAPIFNGYGYDEAITNGGQYTAIGQVSQGLFRSKILEPQYNDISLQSKGAANDSKISERDLKKNIIAQYITAYSDYIQLNFTLKLDTLLHSEEKILKQLAGQGIYKENDYLSFLIEIQSQDIAINQQKLLYKNDLTGLALLAGIGDTNTYTLAPPDIEQKGAKNITATPFFLHYTIDSFRISNQKAVIDARYRPQLNFMGDAGINAVNPAIIYKNFGFSLGLGLTVPIYDGGLKKLDYDKVSIAEDTRHSYQAAFMKQYTQQVAQINNELAAADALIAQIKNQQKSIETLVLLDRDLIEKGNISITDYILAIKSMISAQHDLKQAETRRQLLVNELNYWNW